jgi:hypothetical protein
MWRGRTSSISACRSLLGVSGGFYAKDKGTSSCATCDADHAALPSALIASLRRHRNLRHLASDMTGWSAASPGPLRTEAQFLRRIGDGGSTQSYAIQRPSEASASGGFSMAPSEMI